MEILFGFNQHETEVRIVNILKNNGIEVEYTERESKASIKAYLEEHTECDTAVIRVGMGVESFSAAELAELTDDRDINIIVIASKANRGSEFLEILYAAGITGAILVDDKNGASVGQIAELIMHRRSRRNARTYYGMKNRRVNLDILSYESFVRYYTFLIDSDRGINIVDRFISIVNELTVKQTVDFIRRIPVDVRSNLSRYEEFFMVIDSLSKEGVTVKLDRPEKLIKGLTDEEFTRAIKGEKARKFGKEEDGEPADAELRKNPLYITNEKKEDENINEKDEAVEERSVKESKRESEATRKEETKPKDKGQKNPWKAVAYAAISLFVITVAAALVFIKYSAL